MTYRPIPLQKRGAQDLVPTSDTDAHQLLEEILIQQRLMAMHLGMITDEKINKEDLDL